MKNVNELRKLIRETFYLMEAPPGGYFQSLNLQSKKVKADNKSDLSGKKAGETSIKDHPFFNKSNTSEEIDKMGGKVLMIIKEKMNSTDSDKFLEELKGLNDKIKMQAKEIKNQIKAGGGILLDDENKMKTYFNEVKKLLLHNSPNSLKDSTVTSWYRLKPQ